LESNLKNVICNLKKHQNSFSGRLRQDPQRRFRPLVAVLRARDNEEGEGKERLEVKSERGEQKRG